MVLEVVDVGVLALDSSTIAEACMIESFVSYISEYGFLFISRFSMSWSRTSIGGFSAEGRELLIYNYRFPNKI